jgi:hypothetical protein
MRGKRLKRGKGRYRGAYGAYGAYGAGAKNV